MDAVTLYLALTDRGIVLRRDGGRLIVSPSSALTPEDRAAIALHKPTLLALVLNAEIRAAEYACWSSWWDKLERFGMTPADDPRPDARVASDVCLAAHARYMALLAET